jgi:hypothetical protein
VRGTPRRSGWPASSGVKMNRHERRKAKAIGPKLVIPKITKVHESGHALGRVLTIRDFAYDDSFAIDRIEFDFKNDLATTYGPVLAKEMDDRIPRQGSEIDISVASIREACEGMDVSNWMRAKLFLIAMGPAAEARFLGKPLEYDLLSNEHCHSDLQDMVDTCAMAGISKQNVGRQIGIACVQAGNFVYLSEAWEAINRLADALPDSGGRFDGKKAIRILAILPFSRGEIGRDWPVD